MPRHSHPHFLITLIASTLGSHAGQAMAEGQVVHPPKFTFRGECCGVFGWSVSDAGDVNNDGTPDLIVGDRLATLNGVQTGTATVFSGADGSILCSLSGDSEDDRFGGSVSGAGDVNNDGFDDVIVGARVDDNNGPGSGSARVFSGADGSVLYTFNGDSDLDYFGTSVSDAGDVNNDGYADVIVGAFGDAVNGYDSGSARVFSGADGSILHTWYGEARQTVFGWAVSGAGDLNDDGFDDVLVGAPGRTTANGSGSGSAFALSGADGSVLFAWNGDSAGDSLGWSVSGAGDVNNDSVPDLIVGAWTDDNNGSGSGSARVFSGADGSILYTFNGDSESDAFGWSVSGAGDVNGDGFADLIVGAPSANVGGRRGMARVLSGIDGTVLFTFFGANQYSGFGYSVSGAGDINSDSFNDFCVGDNSEGFYTGNETFFGSATLFVSAPVCPGDADASRLVNFDDLTSVLSSFGSQPHPFGLGDADGSGRVDFDDLTTVLANFGVVCP